MLELRSNEGSVKLGLGFVHGFLYFCKHCRVIKALGWFDRFAVMYIKWAFLS